MFKSHCRNARLQDPDQYRRDPSRSVRLRARPSVPSLTVPVR